MYVRREISVGIIWHFAWRSLIFFTAISCVAVYAYSELKLTVLAIPFLPVATVGTAVAFYAGFKNNASYERLWEGRKVWAEIEHLCRFAGMIVLKSTNKQSTVTPVRKQFVYGLIAWSNALRAQLRMVPTFHGDNTGGLDQVQLLKNHPGQLAYKDDMMEILNPICTESEAVQFLGTPNLPVALMFRQLTLLDSLRDESLAEADYVKLLDVLSSCSQQQAAAERLNNFPFPRQYAHFSSVFVKIFVVLLPFSLLNELKTAGVNLWLTVPFSVLISWVFFTMERVGDTSENPFENALNDVPMSSICRGIEIDLKSMLGEKDLPPSLEPQQYVIL